jgi:hypothetical protein
MGKSTRLLAITGGALAATAVIAAGAASVGAKSGGRKDSGIVFFAVTHSAHGKQFAAGNSSDKLFGTGAVTYVNTIRPTTTGTIKVTTKPVVLFYKDGTLTGAATSDLTVGQNGAATITNGKINAAHGTGAQKGHTFVGTFTGTGNATANLFTIKYKGTYK